MMWRGRGAVQILDELGLIMETESVGLCNVIPSLLPCSAPTLIQLCKDSCCFSVPPGQICASLKVVLFYLDYVQKHD